MYHASGYWFSFGRPLLDWVWEIGNHLGIISTTAGTISVGGWIFAGIYQIYINYVTKQVDGFSRIFLICWVAGDLANVVGSFFTGQLFFQRLVAALFLCLDTVLLIQYYYYMYIYDPGYVVLLVTDEEILPENDDETSKSVYQQTESSRSDRSPRPLNVSDLLVTLSATSSLASAAPLYNSTVIDDNISMKWIIGTMAGYICSFLYFISAVPQLITNHQHKSTGNVSVFLFLADMIGNFGYSLSIFANGHDIPDSEERWEFFRNEMPFLAGFFLVFCLELLILYQFYIYRGNKMIHGSYSTEELVETYAVDERSEITPLISAARQGRIYLEE